MKEDDLKYQTPESICRYMADMIPAGSKTILEPTPGIGNLVRAIESKGDYTVQLQKITSNLIKSYASTVLL